MSTQTQETPTVEKKVTAKKAPAKKSTAKAVKKEEVQTSMVTEVTSTVTDAVKASVDTVKEATTKVTSSVSDATHSTVDTVKEATTSTTNLIKDTYTDIETAINDSKVAGNERAKKIVTALADDKANETVVNFFGHVGGASSICATIVCSPMRLAADSANSIYKKLTA